MLSSVAAKHMSVTNAAMLDVLVSCHNQFLQVNQLF